MAQKLIFPQEIEVWYVLPAIRKYLAAKLVHSGMAQKEVAELMHLTGAAISQYKNKRAQEKIFDNAFEKEVRASVKKISLKKELLFSEIIRLGELAKKRGLICRLHREKSKLNREDLPCTNCSYK